MSSETFDQAMITSYFTECMDIVHSEIKPGSSVEVYSQPLNQAPATVQSVDGKTWQTQYLSYPLYPVQGDVMDFSRSYLWVDYTLNCGICVAHNTYCDHYIAMGPRSSNGTPSRIQLNMNGLSVLDDNMNFLHAALQSAGVNASECEHSSEYATIDGLLKNKASPMRIYKIPKTTGIDYSSLNASFTEYLYSTNYNYSIDLNRLCILTSNFQYTTVFDGSLTLNCFYLDMLENFHYMMLPSESSLSVSANAAAGTFGVQSSNGILTINPVRWGTKPTVAVINGGGKFAVDFGNCTEWVPIAAPYTYVLTEGGPNTLQLVIASETATKDFNDIVKSGTVEHHAIPANTGYISVPIMFTFSKGTNPYVLQFNQSAIYQYVCELREEAKERLHQIFTTNNNIIVRPTQRFVTVPFVDSQIGPNPSHPPPTIQFAKVEANNITHVIISQTINNQHGNGCLLNTFKNDFQVLAEGMTLNQLAYNKVDGRVIKDYTNAIWDTDNEEINNDYLYSLTFPSYISAAGGKAPTDRTYFVDGDFENMRNINLNSAQKIYFKQPNSYFDVFSTGAPSSFMTGICIAPRYVGQLQIGLRSGYESFGAMNLTTRYKPTPMYNGTDAVRVLSFEALTLPSYIDRDTITWCTVLQDCTLTSMYDPNIRRANGASIIPTFPFADGVQ